MKCKLLLVSILLLCLQSIGQHLTKPPDGGNKKASVSERIGITDITIHYDRPAVKGREGKIWGGLVPYGFTDQGFGTSKAAPWRAGANENTTIHFSTDALVEGIPIAAGTYALFLAMEPAEATVILSKNASSWGSFFYDPAEDALRVKVKTVRIPQKVERLTYEFTEQKDNSAIVSLLWENLQVPFTISVDYVKTQLESIRKELRSDIGFKWESWVEAVNFAVANNTNLEEALRWSDYAINGVFVGQKNFRTLSARATVLVKLNRKEAAAELMKEAMPLASMQELHGYGRQQLLNKNPKEALETFKLNAQKHPNVFTTNMGLARGYSGNGDFKTAAKYARLALSQAPDKANRDAVSIIIAQLDAGKDIN